MEKDESVLDIMEKFKDAYDKEWEHEDLVMRYLLEILIPNKEQRDEFENTFQPDIRFNDELSKSEIKKRITKELVKLGAIRMTNRRKKVDKHGL